MAKLQHNVKSFKKYIALVAYVKNLPANAGDEGGGDPLKEEMATHASILAWKSHGQRSLAGYSPWSCKRVGKDLAAKTTTT